MVHRMLGLALLTLLPAAALQAGTVSVSPAAFMDDERDRTAGAPAGALPYLETSIADGYIKAGISSWPTCVDAPLLLPHDALLTRITLWAVDDSSTEDLVLELRRKPIGTAAGVEIVADVGTVGVSGAVQVQFEPISHRFDREGYVYALHACLRGPRIYNVAIDYDGPTVDSGGRSPVTVHPAAFRETTGRAEAVHRLDDGYAHSIWGQTEHLVAPLELPEGVTITRLGATLSNPGKDGFSIRLLRKRLNNFTAAEVIGEVLSTPGDGNIQTPINTDITEPVVDSAYEYYLLAYSMDGTDGQRIYDVTVEHDDLLFADGFESGDTSRWNTAPGAATNRILLTAAAFRAYISAYSTGSPPSQVISHFDWSQGAFLLEPTDVGWFEGFCGVAPVFLPEGAEIAGWTLWGFDANPSLNMTVELRRKRANLPSSSLVLSSITSAAAPGDFGQLALVSHTVDNFGQHLYFSWCQLPGVTTGDFALRGIELFYRP